MIKRFFKKDESGVAAMEYGLIASLIAVAALLSVTSLGTSVKGAFCNISYSLNLNLTQGCTNTISDTVGQIGYGSGYFKSPSNLLANGCDKCLNGNKNGIADDDALYALNQLSPIVSFYGLKDANGNDMTTLADAYNALQVGNTVQADVVDPKTGDFFSYEVATKDGNAYGMVWNGSENIFKNLVTGAAYSYNSSTGQLEPGNWADLSATAYHPSLVQRNGLYYPA